MVAPTLPEGNLAIPIPATRVIGSVDEIDDLLVRGLTCDASRVEYRELCRLTKGSATGAMWFGAEASVRVIKSLIGQALKVSDGEPAEASVCRSKA
jgi:hypothetical protein